MALNEWLVTPAEWRRRADLLGEEINRLRAATLRGTTPEPWAAPVADAVTNLAFGFREWREGVSSDLLSEALGLYSTELREWSNRFDALAKQALEARARANLPALVFATNLVPEPGALVEVKGNPLLWMALGAGLLWIFNDSKGK